MPDRFKIKEVFSKFNLPKNKSTNFLEIKPTSLNGYIQNSNSILEFDAESYLIYELHKLDNDKSILLKSFSGERGKVTFTEPAQKKNSKYFLITKIKNYATGEEVTSEKSNTVEIIAQNKKIISTENSNKWYI